MHPIILILIFLIATALGYKIIKTVPSLLHTPLMSGMNALAGVSLLGALTATALAVHTGNKILGFISLILAMVNVAGGFAITHRILAMFKQEGGKDE